MKKSKRNFVILGALLCGVVYGTFLVASSTTVPVREKSTPEKSALYLRSLERRLYVLVEKKQFPEAEIVFRRLRKLKTERSILCLGSVVCYRNRKFNEAENLLRNLLLRDPGDFVCRNNYAMVLAARNRMEAVREMEQAWRDSGKKAFIGKNLLYCARVLKVQLPGSVFIDPAADLSAPPEAITAPEEKR